MIATGKKKKIGSPLRLECTASASFLALAFLLLPAGCAEAEREAAEAAWLPTPLEAEESSASQDGREVIRRMAEFMDAQQELIAEAFVTYQALQDSGQKLHFDMLQRIALRRPDKLRWKTLRDDSSVDTAWFSNGRFTLHKQPSNIWAQVEGPDKVSDLVTFLGEEYEVYAPFRDLLLSGKAEEVWLTGEFTSVVYVGEAWVEGAWSEHVAVRKSGLDFEIWVRKGPEPFPSKLTIVFTDAPGQPIYSARFRKWETSVPDNTIFEFEPPPGSEQIEAVPVNR